MKHLLIISPYFPPSNAADMQRVRMSLPYFKQFGWDAEVVVVDEKHSEMVKDELLLQTIPQDVRIHKIGAFSKKITAKFGLGSVALRSLWFYRSKVNKLLKTKKFDLIYFSTTQFPVCILGAYWKKKFGVSYVIDMQDPWFSDYYQYKPKDQRPRKYWFSYRLHKYLEPIAMKQVSGLISVSEGYINVLKSRYIEIKNIPAVTIPFGAFKTDLTLADRNKHLFEPLLKPGFKNIVYIGRGGTDMHSALNALFTTLKNIRDTNPELLKKIKLYFLGTSYAPKDQGKPSILPLAKAYEVDDHVIEITNRLSYYHTLITLQQADALFIPGSDDPQYTPSKIYPYLLIDKPLLAVLNSKSPALKVLHEYGAPFAYGYADSNLPAGIKQFVHQLVNGSYIRQQYNEAAIEKYSAENMTKRQCAFFDSVTG